MRAHIVLWAAVIGVVAGVVAAGAVHARTRMPASASDILSAELPASVRSGAPAADPAPPVTDPIDLHTAFATAVAQRDWATASDLDTRLQAHGEDDERLVSLRDALTRGRRRDVDNVVESELPLRLAAWMPQGTWGIGSVRGKRALTIRRDRTQYPLVLVWPRPGQGDDQIVAMLAECSVLAIQGVEIPVESKADPVALQELIGKPIRFLSGTGLAALPPAVLTSLTALKELDLRGLSPTQTSAFLAAVRGHAHVRRIVCSPQAGSGVDDIHHLATLPALAELVLGGSLSDQDSALAPLAACAALRVLELSNRHIATSDWVALAAGCPQLTRLRGARFGAEAADGIRALAATALADLSADVSDLAALTAVTELASLTTLQLTLDVPLDQPWPIGSLARLPAVTDLVLIGGRTAPLQADEITGFAQAPTLRTLRCVGRMWGDALLTPIAELPHLDRLTLLDSVVTNAGLAALAASRSLTNLHLSRCPNVTGAVLTDLVTWPTLRTLRLERCQVDEAHLLALAAPGGLTQLALTGSPVFTTASLDHIATWTFRPRVELDSSLMDEGARKRLEQLNRSAIAGTMVRTEDANDF